MPLSAHGSAGLRNRVERMIKHPGFFRIGAIGLALVVVLFLVLPWSCSGDEPEERRAFAAFLAEKVLSAKGAALPELAGKEKRAVGRYAEHYTLLQSFQKDLAKETEKNAKELLALTAFENLAALAGAEKSLRKAAREAEEISKLVTSLMAKADNKKDALSLPEDIASAYNAAYDKIVSRPGAASSAMFASVRATFAAILDLLDFVASRSRDMEIDGKNINLKNIGLKKDLQAKMAAVRERSLELGKAYAEMMQTMLQ